MVAIAGFSREQILAAVRQMYAESPPRPPRPSTSRPGARRASSSAIRRARSRAFPTLPSSRLRAWAIRSAPASSAAATGCSTSAPGPARMH
jgi:hypothetical protein